MMSIPPAIPLPAHLNILQTTNYTVKLITTNIPYTQEWREREKNGRMKIYKKYTGHSNKRNICRLFYNKALSGVNNLPSSLPSSWYLCLQPASCLFRVLYQVTCPKSSFLKNLSSWRISLYRHFPETFYFGAFPTHRNIRRMVQCTPIHLHLDLPVITILPHLLYLFNIKTFFLTFWK